MVYLLMGSATAADYHQEAGAADWPSVAHTVGDMTHQPPVSSVCKQAMLKKVKTNKNKFFVLHKDSMDAPARLEYYDTESHWNKKKKAKRTIYLRTCFSINPFSDARVKYGIALFTKVDSFQIGFTSEQTRDMWLADMRLLSHSSPTHGHNIVEHMWHVQAQTRSMKSPFEGAFKLCLNDQQASLLSKENPEHMLALPLNVITHCVLNNRYFALEVNHSAPTGPGEIWMELEDSLIAQHVHRAFVQNRSLVCSGEDAFRPVSRSLTFKDKNAAMSARLRSGSDAKLRSRIGQTLYKYSSMALSATNFTSTMKRGRSDSVDSHSTTTSLSTDESECCHNHNWQSASRSVTPDPRADSQAPYMPMNMVKKNEDNCKCLSSTSSLASETAAHAGSNPDMNSSCIGKAHDRNYNLMYMDMSGSHLSQTEKHQENKSTGYIDMTVGGRTSPSHRGYNLKPEPVKCYVSEDGGSPASNTKSEMSPRGKTQVNNAQTSEYVDMCRRHMLTGRDKSSSAPHLIPASHYQQQSESDLFMNLEFDNRDRTASLSCTHRPRGSSWSQSIRPRSSTTEQKRRWRTQRTGSNNIIENTTDYIDMTQGSNTTGYVEMSLDKNSKQRLELARKEDKENYIPYQTSPRVSLLVAHPFPELMSASSDDDVSLNSMDGSMSLHSLTSSADSMSTSSHSSHHSNAFISPLDAEPYVAMQSSPTFVSSTSYVRSNTHRLLLKPARVASYIVDEVEDSPKAVNQNDYVEMSPATNKHTKQ